MRISTRLVLLHPCQSIPITTLGTAHANPVVADSAGRFPAIYYGADDYKVKLTDASDVEIYSQDYAATVLGAAEVGAALYPVTAAETTAGVTPTNYQYQPGNVLRYGTNTTPGTTDMSTAFQSLFTLMTTTGYGVIPPGDYLVGSQVTLDFANEIATTLHAYGARIVSTSLADFPFFFGEGSGQRVKRVIAGLSVDHWDNTTSTGAFEISNAHNLTFEDCSVIPPDNPASGYAAWYYHQSDTADSGTGCFWNRLSRCNVRGDTTPSTKSIAVHIKGSINAFTVDCCTFTASSVGVKHRGRNWRIWWLWGQCLSNL